MMDVANRLLHKTYVQGLAWNPDGSKLATLSDFGALVTIWNSTSWQKEREIRQYSAGYAGPSIGWTSNTNVIASAGAKIREDSRYSLNVWNSVSGALIKRVEGPSFEPPELQRNQASKFAVSKSGSYAAMKLGHVSNKVILFKTADWSIDRIINLDGVPPVQSGFVTAMAFSPDEGSLLIANGPSLETYAIETGERISSMRVYRRIPNASAPIIESVKFSPDGRYVVSAPIFFKTEFDQDPVRLVDLKDNRVVAELSGRDVTTRDIDWSPDGARLAFVSDERLSVWNVSFPEQTKVLSTFDGKVSGLGVAFSPAGHLAVAKDSAVLIFR